MLFTVIHLERITQKRRVSIKTCSIKIPLYLILYWHKLLFIYFKELLKINYMKNITQAPRKKAIDEDEVDIEESNLPEENEDDLFFNEDELVTEELPEDADDDDSDEMFDEEEI